MAEYVIKKSDYKTKKQIEKENTENYYCQKPKQITGYCKLVQAKDLIGQVCFTEKRYQRHLKRRKRNRKKIKFYS